MLDRFKNHPFGVSSFFEHSLVLTYAVPAIMLQKLLPLPLELDIIEPETGFVAAAFVKTNNLRPACLPTFLGNDFTFAGYRIFVKYQASKGKKLRGLYILRSETNSLKILFLGSIFTRYTYTFSNINIKSQANTLEVSDNKSNLAVKALLSANTPELPSGSYFNNWQQARRFAGPLPFTFSAINNSEVLIVEGLRQNWQPKPVAIELENIPYFNSFFAGEAKLSSAYVVQGIDYKWKKGVIDKWK